MRLFFDKYIIKYTNDLSENWSLKTPYLYEVRDTRSIQYINTFSKENQNQIMLLLSMFQTIYTAKNYKNWLFSILDGFVNNNWNVDNYIGNLEGLAKKIAENSNELDKGTKVRHFIFNYLDYLLYNLASIQNSNLSIGGTGILIIVTVALETIRQINSRALMVTYDDYK